MTSRLFIVALIALSTVAGTASAARIGGIVDVGPTPYVPGEWRARVKYINPHTVNGQHFTYSYLDIVASTQAGCEQQLGSMRSVTVVEYCHFVAY